MHMADALISPAVGGAMWAASAGIMAYSSKKIKEDADENKVPLMGVLGAFVFAAQMINFTIPATGSSGHLGGGILLAILIGPYAGFLTIASVLAVQALFFADGGLLALGCNIFNLGFFPCFIAYPLIYKKIAGERLTRGRIFSGATLAAIVGLQLGAFGVVLETCFSGISELPLRTFVMLMQPIHLAIGVVEGLVTAGVVLFVWKARPEILEARRPETSGRLPMRRVFAGLLAAAVLIAGGLSWFASGLPDGLEWAVFHSTGKEAFDSPGKSIYASLARIQEETAFLPDYSFKKPEPAPKSDEGAAWPAVDAGTTAAGLIGGGLTLAVTGMIGFLLRRRSKTV